MASPDIDGDGVTGISMMDALKGSAVVISNVKGIIDVPEAKLYIIKIKMPPAVIDIQNLIKVIEQMKAQRIGTYGLMPRSILEKNGIDPDFTIASVQSCIECAMKGQDSVLIAEEKDIPHIIITLAREFDYWGRKLDYEVING